RPPLHSFEATAVPTHGKFRASARRTGHGQTTFVVFLTTKVVCPPGMPGDTPAPLASGRDPSTSLREAAVPLPVAGKGTAGVLGGVRGFLRRCRRTGCGCRTSQDRGRP